MTDQKDPTKDVNTDYRAHSSKPKAIFVVQAQVTYDLAQLRSTFIRPMATVGESQGETLGGTYYPGILDPNKILQFPTCTNNGNPEKFDYHCHHIKSDTVINPRPGDPRNALSALDALDVTDPPAWMRYDRTATSSSVVPLAIPIADGGEDQTAVQAGECYDRTSKSCLDVHHPNFGLAMRQKYLALPSDPNKKAYVYVQYAPTNGDPVKMDQAGKNFFERYWCFFIKYKRGSAVDWTMNITSIGETRRMNAMQSYVDNYDPDAGDPPPTAPSTCGMTESDVWNWAAP